MVLALVILAAISLCHHIKVMSFFVARHSNEDDNTSGWPMFSHHRVWIGNERCDEFFIEGHHATRKQYYSARISLALVYIFGILAITFVISGISMLVGNTIAG